MLNITKFMYGKITTLGKQHLVDVVFVITCILESYLSCCLLVEVKVFFESRFQGFIEFIPILDLL
jgi:hypothetical protein